MFALTFIGDGLIGAAAFVAGVYFADTVKAVYAKVKALF